MHEPDLPVPVGIETQLHSDDAAQAVEDYGPALLLSLADSGGTLSTSDAHLWLTANREERGAVLAKLVELRVQA